MARGSTFVARAYRCRERIAELALEFVQDDAVVLVHGLSKVVTMLLLRAAAANRRFKVLVTESKPTSQGFDAVRILQQHGVPASVILDAAVGHYIGGVDMVLVGAEGVVENGGVVNQIGTYVVAVMARAANVPFYAVAESHKFVRFFPLSQLDLPSHVSGSLLFADAQPLGPGAAGCADAGCAEAGCAEAGGVQCISTNAPHPHAGCIHHQNARLLEPGHPSVDYTPPAYITLLFTDLGVLTPSGVSDELIKLYY